MLCMVSLLMRLVSQLVTTCMLENTKKANTGKANASINKAQKMCNRGRSDSSTGADMYAGQWLSMRSSAKTRSLVSEHLICSKS